MTCSRSQVESQAEGICPRLGEAGAYDSRAGSRLRGKNQWLGSFKDSSHNDLLLLAKPYLPKLLELLQIVPPGGGHFRFKAQMSIFINVACDLMVLPLHLPGFLLLKQPSKDWDRLSEDGHAPQSCSLLILEATLCPVAIHIAPS